MIPPIPLAITSDESIMKQKATIIVEKASDGGFSCFVDEDLDGFGLAGYGDTAKEAISDLQLSYAEIKEMRAAEGLDTPELDFSYRYDMQSFFDFFSYLNITRIGELAGINSSLLRQYASGAAKAGQKQYDKIRDAVQQIVRDLSVATF